MRTSCQILPLLYLSASFLTIFLEKADIGRNSERQRNCIPWYLHEVLDKQFFYLYNLWLCARRHKKK